jgi:predicted secreted protein
MAAVSARDMSFVWNSVTLSSYFDDTTLSQLAAILEVTTFGATAKAKISGLKDGKLSAKGVFDSTADAALGPNVGTSAAFTWKTSSGANSATNPQYSGTMILAKYDIEGSVGDKVKASVEFEITGAVSRATS